MTEPVATNPGNGCPDQQSSSIPARVVCSPAIQSLYAQARRVPILGELLHKLMKFALPIGTRVNIRIHEGYGSGLLLSLDPRFEASYASGLYESKLLNCLVGRLKQGDVIYDVGGHVGFISLISARIVGPEGFVYSFEADPDNASRIRAHARMNAQSNLEVIPTAVWSECTTLLFEMALSSSSRNTGAVKNSAEETNGKRTIQIEAIALDRFAQDHPSPAVVKIDVEGAEQKVLEGSETLFRTSKPLLVCEIHSAETGAGVADWLKTMGYSWEWLEIAAEFPRHLVAQPTS